MRAAWLVVARAQMVVRLRLMGAAARLRGGGPGAAPARALASARAGASSASSASAASSAAPESAQGRDGFVDAFRAEHPEELAAIAALRAALREDQAAGRLAPEADAEAIVAEYGLQLAAVREKVRLTVGWNSTSRMTDRERVRATAHRVGLTVPDDYEQGQEKAQEQAQQQSRESQQQQQQ
jgi:hypothetical protein